jgi:hypothetical protein
MLCPFVLAARDSFLPPQRPPCARSYGGEDCVAAQITLAGSSGEGLRQVVSTDARW